MKQFQFVLLITFFLLQLALCDPKHEIRSDDVYLAKVPKAMNNGSVLVTVTYHALNNKKLTDILIEDTLPEGFSLLWGSTVKAESETGILPKSFQYMVHLNDKTQFTIENRFAEFVFPAAKFAFQVVGQPDPDEILSPEVKVVIHFDPFKTTIDLPYLILFGAVLLPILVGILVVKKLGNKKVKETPKEEKKEKEEEKDGNEEEEEEKKKK
ncbi:hypothetical protein M0812_03902 [Anaeramoeba flamelloides]|uniref:Translocon-associated protein subunit alpha n=1 Tax=Anaeramoeba flamelloides TaxID=1746091 RepID=A0AAV8ACY7_9EUKA|nr:hypothetical protein M0812_03902 [Anaeramoeba flamelloides]